MGAAVGETGGVAQPPIDVPSAPVGLQGAPGGEAAWAGEIRRRAKAHPAKIGPYRTTQAVTGERREADAVGTRGTRNTESPWRIVGGAPARGPGDSLRWKKLRKGESTSPAGGASRAGPRDLTPTPPHSHLRTAG